MENQNEMTASVALSQNADGFSQQSNKVQQGSSWYYQATRLSSKYHVYGCILMHLIDMVQVHMDIQGNHYPDSVDCDFKSMHNAVRIVSTERCNISSVEYNNVISVKEKDSQCFNLLYQHIASTDPTTPTTLAESMLSHICNPITRPVMQDVEWIRQRLCHLDGILSAKQIDVLKSISSPLIRQGTVDELDWDTAAIRPRLSHPLVRDISDKGQEGHIYDTKNERRYRRHMRQQRFTQDHIEILKSGFIHLLLSSYLGLCPDARS